MHFIFIPRTQPFFRGLFWKKKQKIQLKVLMIFLLIIEHIFSSLICFVFSIFSFFDFQKTFGVLHFDSNAAGNRAANQKMNTQLSKIFIWKLKGETSHHELEYSTHKQNERIGKRKKRKRKKRMKKKLTCLFQNLSLSHSSCFRLVSSLLYNI